ncbi:MAG TPA: polysaccharide deacetylase family protein, partial [Sphingobacteriaceae bacterium]|nr:polysaccharide deacetylase family protein [Sphingobacteriaceae bacterium]
MYLVKSPFWLQLLYPALTWHKSRMNKCIYLTFDDGPIPDVTPFVLETLKTFGTKATFFCIGDNVRKHPGIFEQVVNEGHHLGNHTFNHLRGWDTPDDIYLNNVKQCADLVRTNLFRPPYGRAKKSQYSALHPDYSIIMWDVLSGDFDTELKPEKCLQNVLKHTGNGSIVVFHDSIKA